MIYYLFDWKIGLAKSKLDLEVGSLEDRHKQQVGCRRGVKAAFLDSRLMFSKLIEHTYSQLETYVQFIVVFSMLTVYNGL